MTLVERLRSAHDRATQAQALYGGWGVLEEAAKEIERLLLYPEVIQRLKKCQYTDARICEEIESLVKAAAAAKGDE
jgi:hypothetical protein